MCSKFRFQFLLIICFVLGLTMLPLGAGPPSCDGDGDGYDKMGKKCGGTDCDDSDRDIYPGASEVCNGVDDDCDGSVDEEIQGCGTGGLRWICKTDFNEFSDPEGPGSLEGCKENGLGCEPGDASVPGDPPDRLDGDCYGILSLGAGGGVPEFKFSCMINSEYNGFITPFVPTGNDQVCGTRDDPFMMRLGKHLLINDTDSPTHLVGEEYNRLASKSPDRLYQTYTSYTYDDPIEIRDGDGNPIQFTLPARCHEAFYCFQGKQCKGEFGGDWGTYSHTELTCTPE